MDNKIFTIIYNYLQFTIYAVVSILENLFQNIKINFPNVKHAFLRSDEAGCYHCNHLIAAVKDIGDRVGITVALYDFSELQQGKDVCDRVLRPMKAAIRKYCVEGHDIMNIGAMHEALKGMTCQRNNSGCSHFG